MNTGSFATLLNFSVIIYVWQADPLFVSCHTSHAIPNAIFLPLRHSVVHLMVIVIHIRIYLH